MTTPTFRELQEFSKGISDARERMHKLRKRSQWAILDRNLAWLASVPPDGFHQRGRDFYENRLRSDVEHRMRVARITERAARAQLAREIERAPVHDIGHWGFCWALLLPITKVAALMGRYVLAGRIDAIQQVLSTQFHEDMRPKESLRRVREKSAAVRVGAVAERNKRIRDRAKQIVRADGKRGLYTKLDVEFGLSRNQLLRILQGVDLHHV